MGICVFAWTVAAAALAAGALAGSGAGESIIATCTGTITTDATYEALAVPSGANCKIAAGASVTVNGKTDLGSDARILVESGNPTSASLTVAGNVLLARGSEFLSGGTVAVRGGVIADAPLSVDLEGASTRLGSVDVQSSNGLILLDRASVDDNLSIRASRGASIVVDDSTVGGQLAVLNNRAVGIAVRRNTIGKNLICKGNDSNNIVIFGNIVAGKEQLIACTRS